MLLKDKNGNKGLYCQDFAKEKNFPQVNFEYAYLVKADFCTEVHSVKEQILIMHSVKEQILIRHSVKEQILVLHSVKEQVLEDAQCQGADFSKSKF